MKNLIILIFVFTIFFSIIPTTLAVDQQGLNYTLLTNEYVKSQFTSTITNRDAPLIINFNDTSTGSPTAWNWSYTNVTPGNNTEIWFATTKNTKLTLEKGNWLIRLNASNSAGYNITPATHFVNVSYNAADRRNLTGIPYIYYPSDHVFNVPIDKLPILPNSTDFINSNYGSLGKLSPSFGTNGGLGYDVVDSSLPKSTVLFEHPEISSFSNQYPIVSPEPFILGGIYVEGCEGDCFVFSYERDTDLLYELASFQHKYENGSYGAGAGGIFNRTNYSMNAASGQGTASSSGFAKFPGLVRYDEVASGSINHTLTMFTIFVRSYPNWKVWPASTGGTPPDRINTSTNYPMVGTRFRLNASFDISGYSPTNQVILTALKKYGMICHGSTDLNPNHAWAIQGIRDSRWNNTDLLQLGNVNGTSFEAVDESMLMIDRDSGQVNMTAWASYETNTPTPTANKQMKIGSYNVVWNLDVNGNGTWEGPAIDKTFLFGKTGDNPVVGDWNKNGKTKIGVVRFNNTWLLDASGDGKWGPGDLVYAFGRAGDVYVTGDWNKDNKTEIGVVRNNKIWILDASGNGAYGAGDIVYTYGKAGDRYVTGDWTGTGTTKIGVVRFNTTWLLDASGDGKWGPGDYQYTFGRTGDVYVTGDWNKDGKTEIGVVRNGNTWLLDASGNGKYGAGDVAYTFGKAGDVPVSGKWS